MKIDYSKTEKKWNEVKVKQTSFLHERLATVQKAYEKNLTTEAFQKVQREEYFISMQAELLNDTESILAIYKNAIEELKDLCEHLTNQETFLKEVNREKLTYLDALEKFLIKNNSKTYERFIKETSRA